MANFTVKFPAIFLLFLVLGCSESPFTSEPPVRLEAAQFNHLAITTTDFSVGALTRIKMTEESGASGMVPIHSDAILRAPALGNWIYVVNRFGSDSILVVSKDLKTQGANYRVGKESNPQDIAILNENTAYVSRMGKPSILKVNPLTGASVGKEIDLSDYADADGIPDMTWMRLQGTTLMVQLQRLTNYVPVDYSSVLLIDTQTEAVKEMKLAISNPVTDFKVGPDGSLYLGEAGMQGVVSKKDGGIEKFSSEGFVSQGIVVTEEELGGDIMDFEIISQEVAVAVISTPRSKLVAFNPKTGKRIEPPASQVRPEGEPYTFPFLIQDRARKLFYLADRNTKRPGVRIFNSDTLVEISNKMWSTNLPPFHMALF